MQWRHSRQNVSSKFFSLSFRCTVEEKLPTTTIQHDRRKEKLKLACLNTNLDEVFSPFLARHEMHWQKCHLHIPTILSLHTKKIVINNLKIELSVQLFLRLKLQTKSRFSVDLFLVSARVTRGDRLQPRPDFGLERKYQFKNAIKNLQSSRLCSSYERKNFPLLFTSYFDPLKLSNMTCYFFVFAPITRLGLTSLFSARNSSFAEMTR